MDRHRVIVELMGFDIRGPPDWQRYAFEPCAPVQDCRPVSAKLCEPRSGQRLATDSFVLLVARRIVIQ